MKRISNNDLTKATAIKHLEKQSKIPTVFNWLDYESFKMKITSESYKGKLKAHHFSLIMSPVLDQLECGSCWAIACSTMMSDRVSILSARPNMMLSPTSLLSCVKTPSDGCVGGVPVDALLYMETTGLPRAECAPYDWCENLKECATGCNSNTQGECIEVQNATIPVCDKKLCDSNIRYKWENDSVHHIGSGPDANIIDSIKYSIYMYGPVVATYIVYMDFLLGSALDEKEFINDVGVTSVGEGVKEPWPETKGIYIHGAYDYKTSDNTSADQTISGAHSVVIVGWGVGNAGDKYGEIGYWIVRNSWSVDWGYDGYFHIAMTNKLKNINEFVYLDIPTNIDGNEFGGCVAAFPQKALGKWDPLIHPQQFAQYEASLTVNNQDTATGTAPILYYLSAATPVWIILLIFTGWLRYKQKMKSESMSYIWFISTCIFMIIGGIIFTTTQKNTPNDPVIPLTITTNSKSTGESDIKTQTHNLFVRMPIIMRKFEHTHESYKKIATEMMAAFTATVSAEQLYFGIKDPGVFVAIRNTKNNNKEYMVMDTVLFGDKKTRVYAVTSEGGVGDLIRETTVDFDVHTREWFTRAGKHTTAWTKPYRFADTGRYGITYTMEYDTGDDPDKDIVVASDASQHYMLFLTPTELRYIIDMGDILFVVFLDPNTVEMKTTLAKLKPHPQYPVVFIDITHYKAVAITYNITGFPAILSFKNKKPVENVMYGLDQSEFTDYVAMVL